ncbi:DUF2849 domain-containing protein [Blastomonas aquatica]|uniref:DUF2849 domain-containing protein n=1 Tax=Blastomonas aquatica TaxID=1510276 RepID=A0ABQ1ISM6_9SPHN|nr:DUF2849 domain-containing protein [Blastomonas aquatica]GGB50890.1 hypothetical protein GCM10010833_01990 [Blastomonas aquatica]
MKILTGNDLKTGDVIWWAGDTRWSRHLADTVDAGTDAAAILAREEAARRVNVPYIVDGKLTDRGPMPLHIKERVRAFGPTVRPDLAINTSIPILKA